MAYPNPTFEQSVAELKRQIELEREAAPFLVFRLPSGEQILTGLGEQERISVGRDEGVDISLDGDEEVSRVHAELELVGGSWVVRDDGLSTNGTFVNDQRVSSRRRLADRDLITVGGTGILFRDPTAAERPGATVASSGEHVLPPLTGTQRRVLVELCRPFGTGDQFATPATNREIGERVFLSVDAVKGHLRALFERYGLSDLPQNEKRVRLAERALRSGAIRVGELVDD